jgi:calcium-dependent protein kinase
LWCTQGKYDLVGDPWPKISAGAKDVVKRLLKQDPAERMTAAEALNHPWVREGGVATDTPIDDTIRDRLKNFTHATKFKKMALKVRGRVIHLVQEEVLQHTVY